MDDFLEYAKELTRDRSKLLVVGDYNICHEAIDIHDPIRNKNVSGFLPEERAWMSRFLESGFVDSFRVFNQDPHNYTWWSYRANARANNKGWRLDYAMASSELAEHLKRSVILSEAVHSDHCPILTELS
jgi:exodeoxyribonuclease-3